MKHLCGGKYSGHTTVTDLAYKILMGIESHHGIRSIRVSRIDMGTGSKEQTVKVITQTGCFTLVCKQPGSVQEVNVYVIQECSQAVLEFIARFVRNNKYKLQFGKRI